jgi:hypothetical protein
MLKREAYAYEPPPKYLGELQTLVKGSGISLALMNAQDWWQACTIELRK